MPPDPAWSPVLSIPGPGHLIERAARFRTQATPPQTAAHEDGVPAWQPRLGAGHEAPLSGEVASRPEPVALATLEHAGLVVSPRTRTRFTEEWRIVAAALQRTQRDAGHGRISSALMVTSSRPQEGKSFCALNLAATIAQAGTCNVLLVDLDSKPASLTSLLGLTGHEGLHDLVAHPSTAPGRLVVPTAVPRLAFLPLGHAASRIADAQAGITPLVVSTLERIGTQLPGTLLVLDTPPCLATSDAAALAPHVGQIALVVKAEQTQRGEVETTLALLDTCETITLVLNKALAGTAGHFGGKYDDYYSQAG